jgi:hypothetical protein
MRHRRPQCPVVSPSLAAIVMGAMMPGGSASMDRRSLVVLLTADGTARLALRIAALARLESRHVLHLP